MDEPRTHYQLSFTGRQALLLFVALLGALGVAFAFGLLTGISGRSPAPPVPPGESASISATAQVTPGSSRGAAAATADTTPAADTLELPRPVRGVSPSVSSRSAGSSTRLAPVSPTAVAAQSAPVPTPGLELFEDEGGVEPTPAPSASGQPRRPRAEKAEKAEKGEKTVKTAPPKATPGSSRRASASSAPAFWVQALSASTEKEARAQRDRLVRHGYSVTIVPGAGPGGKRVFRVRVGPYGGREDADRVAARIKAKEKLQPWVVPPGK